MDQPLDTLPKADICPTGTGSPSLLYFNGFEDATLPADWVSATLTGVANPAALSTYSKNGRQSVQMDDINGRSDATFAMKNGIPLSGTDFLYITHAFWFENNNSTFNDGGVLEYSTNGGSTWNDMQPLFEAGQDYSGQLNPNANNPISGRTAFVGESGGYVSSRYNLTNLSGKTAKFRFRVGSDGDTFGPYGWFIDDVRLYSCSNSSFPLSVVASGTGTGTVTSDDNLINCGALCDTTYPVNTQVTLHAEPDAGSVFSGWGGDCSNSGTGDCSLNITAATNVTANFDSYPDFVVTTSDIVLTPNPMGTGTTFSAQVTVHNNGVGNGDAGQLAIWLDNAADQSCISPGEGADDYADVGVILAGASKVVTLTGLMAGAPGTHTFHVFADSACDPDPSKNNESDETNNQANLVYTVTALPDLAVTNIALPSMILAGGNFSVTITVKNVGTGTAPASQMALWLNDDMNPAKACGATGDTSVAVPAIAAGKSTTVTVNGLAAGTAGSKTFGAFVDNVCAVTEPNGAETNNQMAKAYQVVNHADFAVTSILINNQKVTLPALPTLRPANKFDAYVTVKNVGPAGTVGSSSTPVAVWANSATAQNCNAVGDQSMPLGVALASGATVTLHFSNLSSGGGGTKSLRAFVDSTCQTAEPNESNNQLVQQYLVEARADLAVVGLSLTPQTPQPSPATFSATVTVQNVGTLPTAASQLTVWANAPAVQACNATGDQTVAIPALAAGASQSFTFTGLASGLSSGTLRTARAFADSSCVISPEYDETDNQQTQAYTPSPRPDLVITSILPNATSTVVAGNPFTATVVVKNQGTQDAVANSLTVWMNQPNAQNCRAPGNQTVAVPALAAGASTTVSVNLTAGNAATNQMFRGFVDSACSINESSESNNQSTSLYNITNSGDVIVSGITLNPQSPFSGGTFTATVNVKNQGRAAVSGLKLGIWLDKPGPGAPACGATPDQVVTVGNLDVNATKALTFSKLLSGNAGARVFRAFVDYPCAIAESDETNNQLTLQYNVINVADLIVTTVMLSPPPSGTTVIEANTNFTATVTVKNQGTAASTAGKIGIWLDQSALQNCGATPDYTQVLPAIAIGASKVFTFSNLPAGPVPATKTLLAFADYTGSSPNCAVVESVENNNQVTKAYTVAMRPDLMVTGPVTFDPAPLPLLASSTFTAHVTVTNQGQASANATKLKVWVDLPAAPSNFCTLTADKIVDVAALDPQTSVTIDIPGLLAGIAGTKQFRTIVDGTCTITESNETNNQLATPVPVINGPDFVVTGITLNPATPITGKPFTAAVTIKNQGPGSGDAKALTVWLDQPGDPVDVGTTGDATQNAGVIAAGKSKTVTLNMTAGDPTAPGATYAFRAFVDSNNETVETSETNNQFVSNYMVVTPADLTVAQVYFQPTMPSPGSTFAIRVKVQNLGGARVSGAKLTVWADKDGDPVACGATGDKTVQVGPLAAAGDANGNDVAYLNVSGLSAGPVAAGKTLRVFVDSDCKIDGTDSNNQLTQDYQVQNAPDFVITGVNINPDAPVFGGTFSVVITVKNSGTLAGDGGFLDLWLDEPTRQDCGAMGDTYDYIGNLEVGQTATITISGLNPDSIGDGKRLLVFADSWCATTEEDETNNQVTTPYDVVASSAHPKR